MVDGSVNGSIAVGIGFEGITFARADRYKVTENDIGLQHEWDYFNAANAMMRFRDAHHCHVKNCRFTTAGSSGVRFDLNCQSNTVSENLFDYIGTTAVLLCGYGPGKLEVSKNNHIINNHIHHTSELYWSSIPIMIWQSAHNAIRHNLIHNIPYIAIVLSGVRVSFFNAILPIREMEPTIRRDEIQANAQYIPEVNGVTDVDGQWKYTVPYSHTINNLVEENEIFNGVRTMYDGNGIYLSDTGSGNIIHRNYIHHFMGNGMQQGIRTDASVADTQITENVIYNCNGGGINTKHYGNHVFNNILIKINDQVPTYVDVSERKRVFVGYISLWGVLRKEERPDNTNLMVKRNILYKTKHDQPFYRTATVNGVVTEYRLELCDIDYNIYYDRNAPDKGESSLKHYQSRGADANGMVADPLFEDIENGDFRLKKDSPAHALGIKSVDVSTIGLTPLFPKQYDEIVRKQLGDDYDDFKKLDRMTNESDNEDVTIGYNHIDGVKDNYMRQCDHTFDKMMADSV